MLSLGSAVSVNGGIASGESKEHNFGNSPIEEIRAGEEKGAYSEFLLSVKFETGTDHRVSFQ